MPVALKVAKTRNPLDAGTIKVDVTVPRDDGIETIQDATTVTGVLGPCSVIFNVDVSASNFPCKDGLDPITGETFASQTWQVKDHELEYFINNGEDPEAYWPAVGPVAPDRFTLKAPLRGRMSEHHYTQPGTYEWTLMVCDPHTGMVGFKEVTLVIESLLAVANRIVLVNKNDADFSAHDATGLVGTIHTYNLAGATFDENHPAYSENASFNKVVWRFRGFGENSEVFDFALHIDGATTGHSHLFTSYGQGQWTINVPNYSRRLQLLGNGGAAEPKPLRLENFHLTGC